MADYTAIADVSVTLISLLRSNMGDLIANPNSSIILCSPSEVEDNSIRLSLFMYRIDENDYMKNREMQQINSNTLKNPPLILDLFYMLTAYSPIDDPTEQTIEEHKILGMAMRIFYDNAILRGSALQGSMAGTDSELHIVLAKISMENTAQMWNSFHDKSYKPSAFYQVTPVAIDSLRYHDIHRVVEKDIQYYQIKKD